MTDLEQAVANWIRAEYQFRLGGSAFQMEQQVWYCRAERRVRKALTGSGSLEEAFQRIGGAIMPERKRKDK